VVARFFLVVILVFWVVAKVFLVVTRVVARCFLVVFRVLGF